MPKDFSLTGDSNKDHDLLSTIAKHDEVRFEEIRQNIIDEFMASVPVEKAKKLNQTQWKIDQIRRLAKNPIDAYLKISAFMWESARRLNEEQQKLLAEISSEYKKSTEAENTNNTQQQTATILHFKPRKKDNKSTKN